MNGTDFLEQMARTSAARVAAARASLPLGPLRERALSAPPAPRLALSDEGFDLIMELKLASPAQGVLAGATLDLEAQVLAYAESGAAVVSVLTEPSRFHGELAHLARAAKVLDPRGVPVMRKDFLVDPYQLYEARAAGAGGALLIARMLDDALLDELLETSRELGLFVLLEAFDAGDVARCAAAARRWPGRRDDLMIGVNSRDLATLAVVPRRLEALVSSLPAAHPRVAESGLSTAADAQRLAAAGYSLALVGTALMSAADPVALGRRMILDGRAAVRRPAPGAP